MGGDSYSLAFAATSAFEVGTAGADCSGEEGNNLLTPDRKVPGTRLSSASRFLAAQRQKILHALDRSGDFFQQLLQVLIAIDEINLRRIHNQQIGLRVVKEKMFIGLHHFHQVILADCLFADRRLIRSRTQIKRAQLLEAANQKSQLRLESRARLAFVERLQKGIVFRFNHPLRGQTFSEESRQCALPDAYGTFDCNITGKLEKLGHELSMVELLIWSGIGKQNILLRLQTQCGKS